MQHRLYREVEAVFSGLAYELLHCGARLVEHTGPCDLQKPVVTLPRPCDGLRLRVGRRLAGAVRFSRSDGLMFQGRELFIARSLSQTKLGLTFKGTKTGKVRPVALPDSAIAVLNAHREAQEKFKAQFGPDYRSDLDLIFCNPDGAPLRPDSISASVSALSRKLKLPKGTSLHSLRHSHGSHLLAAGLELPAARKWDEFQRQNAPPATSAETKLS